MFRNIIFFLFIINSIALAQNEQTFTRQFQTESGIYGRVGVVVTPTQGYGLMIRQQFVTVEGIKTAKGSFSGISLRDQGVSFPLNCTNCYFFADGQAGLFVRGTGRYGRFERGPSIHARAGGNHVALFNDNVKDLCREVNQAENKNVWLETGRAAELNIYGVAGADLGIISRAVDQHIIALEKKEKFDELISAVINGSISNEEKLSLLNSAKKYITSDQDAYQIENLANKINQDIDSQRQRELEERKEQEKKHNQQEEKEQEKTTEDYNRQFKSATTTNRATSPVMNSGSQKYTLAEHQSRMQQIQYDIDREMASKRAKINAISNVVTGLTNYFYQRAQQKREWQRQQQLRQEAEEERKSAFYRQANLYRSEYKKFVNGRKQLMQRNDLKSLLDEDGTGFKPIFLYFAYTKKGYDYYSENVDYDSRTMNFNIREQASISFSPIFGVFPQINGEYPLISSVKSTILNDHFKGNLNEYDIVFFSWQTSVDAVLTNYQNDINKSVNEHYFTEAVPAIKNEIVFLNTNLSASSRDYWTGEKVKQKNSSKTNYWDKKKVTVKKDSTNGKKKKVNYWIKD